MIFDVQSQKAIKQYRTLFAQAYHLHPHYRESYERLHPYEMGIFSILHGMMGEKERAKGTIVRDL